MFFSFTYRFLNIIAPILVLVFSHSFILYLCTPDNSRPPPLLFSPVENRHCSRVVVVVLGISLLYISSIHSALAALLFLPSRQSTKRKQQYSPVGVALTFHLFFPLILFFISFMLRTCDLWT
uniref:Candidate secreted effector n=1 Tax=Meloidogyne incognita TaxID=6306 RepID=A0A914KS11_MELIC